MDAGTRARAGLELRRAGTVPGNRTLLFYRFDDGLFVVDAVGEARRWIGSRVLAFGPLAAEEALAALPEYTHADNPMSVMWIGIRWTLRGMAFNQVRNAEEGPSLAVFAGEPSSSRPNVTAEETNLVLPYSRVRGTISTLYWQDSDPDDRRPWIAPQVPVTLSSEDYFANRDPVLEAVLRVAAKQERTEGF